MDVNRTALGSSKFFGVFYELVNLAVDGFSCEVINWNIILCLVEASMFFHTVVEFFNTGTDHGPCLVSDSKLLCNMQLHRDRLVYVE